MKKNIVIRVDANKKIGLGHLLRVKGFIYRNIKIYNKFIIITKGDKKILNKILNHKKIKIFQIKGKFLEEVKKIHKIIEKFQCKILLSDISYSYYLNLNNFFRRYHSYFKNNNILTVSIDDPRQFLNSDLSIIPYPINKKFLKSEKNTKLLYGVKYISFNNDIIKNKKYIKNNVRNILIVLSGFDLKRQSLKILNVILKLDYKVNIKVISNNNNDIDLIKKSRNLNNLELILNIKNINNFLDWADLVLTGEGILRFETALKGVPTIFFNNLDNTKKNLILINAFLKLKTARFLNYKTLNSTKLLKLLNVYFKNKKLRIKQSLSGTRLFDVNGASRISFEINKLYNKKYFKA